MKYIIALLWFLSSSLLAFDMVEVLNDDIILHKAGYFVSDKKLTSKEALELSQTEALKPLPKGSKSFGFDERDYWFIFEISNTSETKIYLDSKSIVGNDQELFIFDETTLLKEYKSGYLIPIRERPIKILPVRFELENTQKKLTYLLKINTGGPHYTAFSFGDSVEVEQTWNIFYFMITITGGISIAFLIYNIFLYVITQDKSYFYYCVYIFGFFGIIFIGLGYLPIIPKVEVHTGYYLFLACVTIKCVGLTFFAIHFLKLEEKNVLLKKIFIILLTFNLVASLFYLFGYAKSFYALTVQLLLLFSIFAGLKSYKDSFKPALFYVIATGIGNTLFVGFMLMNQGNGIAYTLFSVHLANIALIWDLIMLSFALGLRIKLLREENIQKERLLMLQSRQKSIGELTGNIAHQWRQPLGKMGSLLSMLEAKLKYERIQKDELLETITQSNHILQYLSQTINTFQNFFHSKHSKELFDVEITLQNLIRFVQESLLSEQIHITLHVNEKVWLKGDENALFQAVLNIVLNAKDALIHCKKDAKWIRIELTCKEKLVMINIENNGGNVSITPIEKVFELFISDKPDGSGMGLFISKTLVESQLHGKLNVSHTNDGVCFTLSFSELTDHH